eukprot:TRINITY_DN1291_c0_g1_i6.p3 TRINITY_DN1291_c0_g1~~TRINITY_DN1291_c0_g1_i6.p3  ORF type:complete len:181 (+),score=1.35 TRINITY_DN1291_c0_g1_i6:470-1012(+)
MQIIIINVIKVLFSNLKANISACRRVQIPKIPTPNMQQFTILQNIPFLSSSKQSGYLLLSCPKVNLSTLLTEIWAAKNLLNWMYSRIPLQRLVLGPKDFVRYRRNSLYQKFRLQRIQERYRRNFLFNPHNTQNRKNFEGSQPSTLVQPTQPSYLPTTKDNKKKVEDLGSHSQRQDQKDPR